MYALKIGPFHDDPHQEPDIVGMFDSVEDAAQYREDLIGVLGWDDYREDIDVIRIISTEEYGTLP